MFSRHLGNTDVLRSIISADDSMAYAYQPKTSVEIPLKDSTENVSDYAYELLSSPGFPKSRLSTFVIHSGTME